MAGALLGAAWIALAGALRQYRGVNETISSLLLAYIAIALFKHLVEGPLRDPASLNKPSTHRWPRRCASAASRGSDVHWGLVLGVVACLAARPLAALHRARASRCAWSAATRAPRSWSGLPANRLIVLACALGGACAGLAGAVEVAAVHTNANASLIAGYGYAGILVAFIARHNPLAIIPVAILFGGFGAAGSLLQRRLGPARCVGAGAAGHRLRADPGQRGAARRRLDGAAARGARSTAPIAVERRRSRQRSAPHDRRPVVRSCSPRSSAARCASARRSCSSASANA